MACLSLRERSANPCQFSSMGDEKTSTRRLNLAQAFNPIGSLLGMFVAMNFIQAKLHPMSSTERDQLGDEAFQVIKESDLSVLVAPIMSGIGIFILLVFFIVLLYKMPTGEERGEIKREVTFPRKLPCNACTVIENIERGSWRSFFTWGYKSCVGLLLFNTARVYSCGKD